MNQTFSNLALDEPNKTLLNLDSDVFGHIITLIKKDILNNENTSFTLGQRNELVSARMRLYERSIAGEVTTEEIDSLTDEQKWQIVNQQSAAINQRNQRVINLHMENRNIRDSINYLNIVKKMQDNRL